MVKFFFLQTRNKDSILILGEQNICGIENRLYLYLIDR